MKALVAFVDFRTLFAVFLAFALLLAPAISRGEALASVPHHDMQMMKDGNCQSPTSHKDGHRAADMSCCTALSVAVTPTVDRPADEELGKAAPASVPLAGPHRPFLGEIATPPPRPA